MQTSFSLHIEVAVPVPVDHPFTYGVPDSFVDAALPGKRVLVPLGRRRAIGYVIGTAQAPEGIEIRPILTVLDEAPLFPESMLPFFRWISEYYIHPLGEVIRAGLPGGFSKAERRERRLTSAGRAALDGPGVVPDEKELLERLRRRPIRISRFGTANGRDLLLKQLEQRGWIEEHRHIDKSGGRPRQQRMVFAARDPEPGERISAPRKEILRMLRDGKKLSVGDLQKQVPTAAALVRAMEKSGMVSVSLEPVYRDPFGDPIAPDIPPLLTPEQESAVAQLITALEEGFTAHLLTGVTGSGKTEVYLRATAEVIHRGRSALILVPEIALITQMERRFRARFGECIAVLHSGLSEGERFDQWMRILSGKASVVIGARSAVFAPIQSLGLVVVDEEHDSSYKQETGLRYNARDMAVVRAKLAGATAVLGSATPSIQAFHNVETGKFSELTLPRRIENRPLPSIEVIDLTKSRDARGLRRFLTPELIRAMEETLKRQEQVLLFLNRRGYAGFPVCSACGQGLLCRNCDISMTYHRGQHQLHCHYCGYVRPMSPTCPSCGSDRIKLLGIGTEKLEEMVQSLFPQARVARMDRDTTSRKGSILKLLKDLQRGAIDILVGTQMVAKGHDFPNITLVGIVCADLSLNFPDFRSGERTFQLLAQVAGRAGRGDSPGRVVLQTYNPGHFCITAARDQNFREFYRREIEFRRQLAYPPYSRLLQILASSKDPEAAARSARVLAEDCRRLERELAVETLGPVEAPLARIAGLHRWQVLLKAQGSAALRELGRRLLSSIREAPHPKVRIVLDVDPANML